MQKTSSWKENSKLAECESVQVALTLKDSDIPASTSGFELIMRLDSSNLKSEAAEPRSIATVVGSPSKSVYSGRTYYHGFSQLTLWFSAFSPVNLGVYSTLSNVSHKTWYVGNCW